MNVHRIPIYNGGPYEIEVGLEPEGDCLTIPVGWRIEIRYSVDDSPSDEPVVELKLEARALTVYTTAIKEVWQEGRRIR